MVRKARSLKSLDELDLKKSTRSLIIKKDFPLGFVVMLGRNAIYHLENSSSAKYPSWRVDLGKALDKAGFIRHDINFKSFCVGKVYKCAYREFESQIIGSFKEIEVNEQYENFHPITDGQFESVKVALRDILSEREYKVAILWFGFEDGKTWDRENIASRLGLPVEHVRLICAKSVRKLVACRAKLPYLFFSQESEDSVNNLIHQLNILHNDPIFKREAELRAQLRDFSHSPFSCAEKATAYLIGRNATDLDKVGFSVRTYNCLRRAGIETISDVLDYPKEEWPKVRNISEKILKEVERKIRALGLSDFTTS